MIAAAIFSPTQSVVLGWTRRRFSGPLDRIKGATERLKKWGLTETPDEIATRALSLIDETIHPTAAAVAVDTPRGPELLAARGAERLDDPRLIDRLTLADEESRSASAAVAALDGNRYNRHERGGARDPPPWRLAARCPHRHSAIDDAATAGGNGRRWRNSRAAQPSPNRP